MPPIRAGLEKASRIVRSRSVIGTRVRWSIQTSSTPKNREGVTVTSSTRRPSTTHTLDRPVVGFPDLIDGVTTFAVVVQVIVLGTWSEKPWKWSAVLWLRAEGVASATAIAKSWGGVDPGNRPVVA